MLEPNSMVPDYPLKRNKKKSMNTAINIDEHLFSEDK